MNSRPATSSIGGSSSWAPSFPRKRTVSSSLISLDREELLSYAMVLSMEVVGRQALARHAQEDDPKD